MESVLHPYRGRPACNIDLDLQIRKPEEGRGSADEHIESGQREGGMPPGAHRVEKDLRHPEPVDADLHLLPVRQLQGQ